MSRIPVTPEGFKKLKEELERLKTIERPKVVNDVSVAAAQGDLSENSEYDDAKERLAMLNRRVGELEAKLAEVIVVDPSTLNSSSVCFGATVQVMDTESEDTISYQLVGKDEVDVRQGRISVESPIGRALLGKKVGDVTKVRVPKGELELEIVKIEFK